MNAKKREKDKLQAITLLHEFCRTLIVSYNLIQINNKTKQMLKKEKR